MAYYPTVTETYQNQQMTDTFAGYNHNPKIAEGEFWQMKNLSADDYPMMATRKRRGLVNCLAAPNGIAGKAKLAYVDGSSLYYGGVDLTTYLTAKGLSLRADTEKQMVSMGAYLVIFQDKVYINTTDYTDCGVLEAETVSSGNVELAICAEDGTAYASPVIGSTPPENPTDGTLWLDVSTNTHVLKVYSGTTAAWTAIPTVYVKISAAGIGVPFRQFDGVQISGITGSAQAEALNGSTILQQVGEDYIVVVGLLDQTHSQSEAIHIRRTVPDMDFIVEADNRLWGCKYGMANGRAVNEIYCCALGDFRNWNQFRGISTDSYAATVGTDGAFTAAINYLGNPLFFKEGFLHKVFPSAAGAHQITATPLRGVMAGSAKSLCVVGSSLYYLSRDGICVYDGTMPSVISQRLGGDKYQNGVAGCCGSKYFISMERAGVYSLFCVDTAQAIWTKEDDTQVIGFAAQPEDTYMLTSDGKLWSLNGSSGEPEKPLDWSAESGLIGYTQAGSSYVSRVNLRIALPKGSLCKLEMQYDSDGIWHNCGTCFGFGTGSFLLPIRPRRCDHFRYRLSGIGEMKLYSLTKLLETGSDAQQRNALDF